MPALDKCSGVKTDRQARCPSFASVLWGVTLEVSSLPPGNFLSVERPLIEVVPPQWLRVRVEQAHVEQGTLTL